MAVENFQGLETELSRLLAKGMEHNLTNYLQIQLEAELLPKIKQQIAENIKTVVSKFSDRTVSYIYDAATKQPIVNVNFNETKEMK